MRYLAYKITHNKAIREIAHWSILIAYANVLGIKLAHAGTYVPYEVIYLTV
ncbi:hypothetical protein MK079_03320 [Candidatus Gracilibacteria bacterium]|nr:hypothetical protein [Candidatus Gracilibacteria bacterium]